MVAELRQWEVQRPLEIIGLYLFSFAGWQTEVQERGLACSEPQGELGAELRQFHLLPLPALFSFHHPFPPSLEKPPEGICFLKLCFTLVSRSPMKQMPLERRTLSQDKAASRWGMVRRVLSIQQMLVAS